MHNVLSALFLGGPILWGNSTDVSTTTLCISFNDFKSLSKLWPINIVCELNIDINIAWTSLRVRVSLANISSVMPEYLKYVDILNERFFYMCYAATYTVL